MIQLYDSFHQASKDLYYSLTQAGFQGPVVVINDDGFLPEGVTSAYSYYCQMETGQGCSLYFNQLQVPPFWEITGTNGEGEVWDYSQRKAKIFYAEPKHLRRIKNVDWFGPNEKVRFTDHYNRFGWLFARTYFNAEQKVTSRIYFNQAKQEVLVENFMTGDIQLNWQGKVYFFDNRVELFRHYFAEMGWELSEIWYNSLSTPFFLSYNSPEAGQDVLFWQEGIQEDIPGNMKVMLNSSHVRTQRVLVQQRQVYQKMMDILPEEQKAKIAYLGYIYPSLRENAGRKEILILTNSDQIEKLEELTQALPDFHFHIGALTEMSQRLMAFEAKSNITLYPNISQKQLQQLFQECDIYLDINHSGEVMDAVRKAFEQNMVILAFEQTVHNRDLIPASHRFDASQPTNMVMALAGFAASYPQMVALQREETSNESVTGYQQLLGKEER
ncbi:accessory Sec system glycosylation chaperone GtfB [Streptococcus suis]|nr:accessory Sec system glycosylation chaperone GtfB [Streptococcus suis]NQI35048.1 accessory Sec system glycosylation chaperone GtfB [Streptococcus suis]